MDDYLKYRLAELRNEGERIRQQNLELAACTSALCRSTQNSILHTKSLIEETKRIIAASLWVIREAPPLLVVGV